MTAPTRRNAAADLPLHLYREFAVERWRRAVDIRREWLGHGLDSRPADRTAAEQVLTRIYARLSRPGPRFVWVDSPVRALPLLAGLPTHDVLQAWIMPRTPSGAPPLFSDLATAQSRLRSALEGCLDPQDAAGPTAGRRKPTQADRDAWLRLPPSQALEAGAPLGAVLRRGVWQALRTCLVDEFIQPVRAALAPVGVLPSAFYGQQESAWIAYYDVLRRLGLARYRPADEAHLDDWVALARCCGWWWPGERVCVMVDRPAAVHTEPVPGALYEQVRLRPGGQPAVVYRDGWCLPPGGSRRLAAAGTIAGRPAGLAAGPAGRSAAHPVAVAAVGVGSAGDDADRGRGDNRAPVPVGAGHTRAGLAEVSW